MKQEHPLLEEELMAFADGQLEVEVYKSDGHIGGQEFVDELLRDFSD